MSARATTRAARPEDNACRARTAGEPISGWPSYIYIYIYIYVCLYVYLVGAGAASAEVTKPREVRDEKEGRCQGRGQLEGMPLSPASSARAGALTYRGPFTVSRVWPPASTIVYRTPRISIHSVVAGGPAGSCQGGGANPPVSRALVCIDSQLFECWIGIRTRDWMSPGEHEWTGSMLVEVQPLLSI